MGKAGLNLEPFRGGDKWLLPPEGDDPLLRRLQLVLFVPFGRPAVDHDTDGTVPRRARGSRIHLAAFRGIKIIDLRRRLDAKRHREDFIKLRRREELPGDRPNPGIAISGLHVLERTVHRQKVGENLLNILDAVRIRNDDHVLPPVFHDALADVPGRRIPASPVSFFRKASHIIQNPNRRRLPFHLSKNHGHVHHRAPDRRGGVDVFLQ